jgi:hypothetical protein
VGVGGGGERGGEVMFNCALLSRSSDFLQEAEINGCTLHLIFSLLEKTDSYFPVMSL